MAEIRTSPATAVTPSVKLINFSDAPEVDGEENTKQGMLLSEARSLMGDRWEVAMGKARPQARKSSMVLLEAFESGAEFSRPAEGVVVHRSQADTVGSGELEIDLSE